MGHDRYKTGQIHDRTDARQVRYKTGQIHDMTDTRQVRYMT